jgi:hypothetical protein
MSPRKCGTGAMLTLASAINRLTEVLTRIDAGSIKHGIRHATPELGKTKVSLTTRALLLVFEHRIVCKAEIARRLGVHRGTVSRLKALDTAIFYIQVMQTGEAPGKRQNKAAD